MTSALAVVLVAYLIRLACLWLEANDGSYLELGRATWSLAAEVLPPLLVAVVLLITVLTP